jgi:outer membrane protein OmpA-like peptidoglycan-associated protein
MHQPREHNNMKTTALVVAVLAAVAAGCQNNPYRGENARTATGATIGAGAGAVLGAGVSGSSDRGKGALIGAAVGATVGGLIGRQMDRQEADLRRDMQGTGVDVVRDGDTIRLNAPDSITFDTNRADVKPQFGPVLDRIAASIGQYPNTVVRVEGHTDSTGSAAYNQTLSENRARSVASYLIQRGISPARITTLGYGFSRPIADNATRYGRAQNRRVEVLIIPQVQ